MKGSIKKPSLDEYDNEEFRKIIERVDISRAELIDYIEEKLDNTPQKDTEMYKKWKKDTNELIDKLNENFGRTYNRVK